MKLKTALYATLVAATMILAACGGGGGGSDGTPATPPAVGASAPVTGGSSASQAIPGTLTTAVYTANTAQLAMFNAINQQRQQCGFPAYAENSILDQAAAAHAQYLAANGVVTDTEVASNAGFAGVTYADRGAKYGLAATYSTTGVSAGYYTNAALSESQYGQQLAYEWMAGVYHIAIVTWPFTDIGVGEAETTFNGFPQVSGAVSIANPKATIANGPLTFPCQGTTGVPYLSNGETPTPPNTSGPWGMPIAVTGNVTDTIVLQSGSITDPSNNVTNLQLLDSATDPNHLLPTFEAVAYSAAPLTANTTYTVNLTGTDNGHTFTKSFTFTTGNVVG